MLALHQQRRNQVARGRVIVGIIDGNLRALVPGDDRLLDDGVDSLPLGAEVDAIANSGLRKKTLFLLGLSPEFVRAIFISPNK